MNTFHDLLTRYAAECGFTVDGREWLMLLELDPVRAAHATTELAVLAAEDAALTIAAEALDMLRTAASRTDATASAHFSAAAAVAAFTERVTSARTGAWHSWTQVLAPLLTEAGVLSAMTRPPRPCLPPRTWTTGTVRLPESTMTYPARISTRRRVAGVPIIRLDADTCQRLAADLRTNPVPVPPTILVDRDRPLVILGAADLEHAWRAGADLIYADADGCYTLTGAGWPWQTDPEPAASARPAHTAARHSIDPARPSTRRTSPASARGGHLRLVTE